MNLCLLFNMKSLNKLTKRICFSSFITSLQQNFPLVPSVQLFERSNTLPVEKIKYFVWRFRNKISIQRCQWIQIEVFHDEDFHIFYCWINFWIRSGTDFNKILSQCENGCIHVEKVGKICGKITASLRLSSDQLLKWKFSISNDRMAKISMTFQSTVKQWRVS